MRWYKSEEHWWIETRECDFERKKAQQDDKKLRTTCTNLTIPEAISIYGDTHTRTSPGSSPEFSASVRSFPCSCWCGRIMSSSRRTLEFVPAANHSKIQPNAEQQNQEKEWLVGSLDNVQLIKELQSCASSYFDSTQSSRGSMTSDTICSSSEESSSEEIQGVGSCTGGTSRLVLQDVEHHATTFAKPHDVRDMHTLSNQSLSSDKEEKQEHQGGEPQESLQHPSSQRICPGPQRMDVSPRIPLDHASQGTTTCITSTTLRWHQPPSFLRRQGRTTTPVQNFTSMTQGRPSAPKQSTVASASSPKVPNYSSWSPAQQYCAQQQRRRQQQHKPPPSHAPKPATQPSSSQSHKTSSTTGNNNNKTHKRKPKQHLSPLGKNVVAFVWWFVVEGGGMMLCRTPNEEQVLYEDDEADWKDDDHGKDIPKDLRTTPASCSTSNETALVVGSRHCKEKLAVLP